MRPWTLRAGVAVSSGLAAAVALGALNQAAHPGGLALRLAWAACGLLAAVAAFVVTGRREMPSP